MTPAERAKAFRRARARQVKRYVAANRDTAKQVTEILADAEQRVRSEIADSNLSEFQAWQLPNIQQAIEVAMAEIGEALAAAGSDGASTTFQIGVDLVDQSLEAGGIVIRGILPDVDLRQLMAIRSFMTDRLKDVSAEAANKIKGQIGVVMIGGQTPGQAVDSVAAILKSGRGRALGIVRTEMGTAFSVATQERQAEASKYLPGLKKQWRRSGKLHSRVAHDLADGQIVDVDKPFKVNGVSLMFPRDPKGPVGERVNCGCVQLPYMESWEMRQPDRQPFSDREIFRNPQKRDLARELNPPVDPDRPGVASIRALETLTPAAARRQIAEDLRSEQFSSFVRGAGQADRDHRAIALIPDSLAAPLGTEASVVRLSSYTAYKQRQRRRGQGFGAGDYMKAQQLLDRGPAFLDGQNHLVVFGTVDKETWRGIFKRTKDGREIYLETLHRSSARQQRRAKRNLSEIRGED